MTGGVRPPAPPAGEPPVTGPLRRARLRLTRHFVHVLYWLYRSCFPTRAAPALPRPERIRRLLIARIDRVGDLVVLAPALTYLRAALPDAEIDLLASARNASLFADDPRLDHVYIHRPTWLGWLESVRRLRARRYDVVFAVRLRDHIYEGVFASLVAGPDGARFTGQRPPQYAGLYTHQARVPQSRTHMVPRLLYLVRVLVGDLPAPPVAEDLRAFPPVLAEGDAAAARAEETAAALAGGRPFVAFNAWGSDPRRGFGVPYAADLAAAVAAARPGVAIVITPPPNRAGEAEAIARRASAQLASAQPADGQPNAGRPADAPGPVVVAPVSRDVRDLVALIRRAAIVLTPDTANVHIASALGRPLLAVYTALAVNEPVWGAWGTPRRIVYLRERRPVREVPIPAVVAAYQELWDEVERAGGPAPVEPIARGRGAARELARGGGGPSSETRDALIRQ